jgi:hypothetical protein
MPMPVGGQYPGGRRFIDVVNNAGWLVTYFEGYVVEKANQEKVTKGRKLIDEVSEDRKRKWYDNAQELVAQHPVHEVVEVIDWIFNSCSGYLPSWVAECSEFPLDRKVTRIRQVEENYDLLLEEMNSNAGPDPVDDLKVTRRTAINYGEPFADPEEEAKVSELVELFTDFRLAVIPTAEIHHTRTWRWAKSFRIMLAHRGYQFKDLVLVITALRDYPEMDRTRYSDAYDLQQRGEWEHLLSAVKLARMKAERRAASSPAAATPNTLSAWERFSHQLELEQDGEVFKLDITARSCRGPLGAC